jgi:protoheme IX farnesyltransferase
MAAFSFKAMASLTRVRLSLVVASFAAAGYFSVNHSLSRGVLFTFSGVALLSAAASVLNQIQEKDLDALMERTKNRPLQLKRFTVRQAFLAALILGCAGSVILFFGTTPVAALLGFFTLVWYNAVYTPIKRKTLFALPVGALTGAFAPVIGSAAATGRIAGPAIGIACFLFFWQVPHFLLMLLKYGPEYEKAGFPYSTILKNEGRFRGIVFIWCVAASVSTLLFPLFGLVLDKGLIAALVLCNGLFVLYFYFKVLLRRIKTPDFNSVFRSLYLFQGSVLVLLIVQGLFPYL